MATKVVTKGEKRLNTFLTYIAWSVVVVAVVTVTAFYFNNRNYTNTNDAQVRQYITPVSSQVSGFIQEVLFKENQFVHKGDTLVIIDNRELREDIEMAKAGLDASESNIVSQRKVVETRASDEQVIVANIEAAKVDVWRTKQDFERFKNLVEQDAATVQQFEEIEAQYRQAQARLSALEQQVHSVKVGVAAEAAKITPVQSEVRHKKSGLEKAKLQFSYSFVLAPYDGWVGTKDIQEGQLIKQGQALVQVVSKEKWIVANFKEKQLSEVAIGSPVSIHVDAYSSVEFKGVVESFSPASGSEFSLMKPNNATGNFVKIEQRFPVRIVLTDSPEVELLRSGMNVVVSVGKK